jgi:hypothetical protein
MEEIIEQAEPAADPEIDAATETAAVETAEVQPEAPESKTFTQEELDKIVEKRLAKERRKLERNQAPKEEVKPVRIEEYATTEEYAEALAERRATEKARSYLAHVEAEKVEKTFRDAAKKFAKDRPDFEEVAFSRVPINEFQAAIIKRSEMGPQLAYYLGENEDEFERIDALPPLLQAKELGKIEAKLAAEMEKPKVSNAPEPIKPIGAKGKAVKSVEAMSDDEFAEHRRKVKAQRR